MSNIRDLARALGVSIGTVSRALNGKPDVNAETRARILAAAAAKGYTANPAARSLRKGSTNIVAFLFAPPAPDDPARDFAFLDIVEGVQAEFEAAGLELVVLPCPASQSPADYVRRLLGRRFFDAMILMGGDRAVRLELGAAGVPVIALEGEGPAATVALDCRFAFSEAVGLLRTLGHDRIGFAPGHCECGRTYGPEVVTLTPSHGEADGRALGVELLSLPEVPTALIVDNDAVAAGVYAALRTAGRVPGRDLSVVSLRAVDDLKIAVPGLARFRYDTAQLGAALARTCLGVLAGQPADGTLSLAIAPGFEPGDSVAAPV